MHLAEMLWCDYVVWIPTGIHVERISRDTEFWNKDICPKLKWLFYICLLPKIASPHHTKGLPIREQPEVKVTEKSITS